MGSSPRPVCISRLQTEAGEQVTVSFEGKSDILWDAFSGASVGGRALKDEDGAIVDRIAMDSADQFIQAQLRGAVYMTIGLRVIPAAAPDPASYRGPAWDVVMVTEPESPRGAVSESRVRLFYINTQTGLLDRVVSKESGATVTAEFGGWVSRNGELDPSQIQWFRNGKIFMRLNFDNVSHGSK